MKNIRLTHNGMTVKFFEKEKEADEYIKSVLEESGIGYKKLTEKQWTETCSTVRYRMAVYQYVTLYSEMFLLEIMD